MSENPILEVKNLSVNYGTVEALKSVSFYIDEGEIIALLGSNGAGKSTALKAICGLLEVSNGRIVAGDIQFNKKSIKNIPPYELVKKGLSLVPEGRQVFPSMTVLENLEMGAYIKDKQFDMKSALKNVFLLFPRLEERKNQKAGTLSSGEQQMLTIGRALMLKPRLLLIDEPSLGLSPNFINIVFEKLKEINQAGTSIVVVEQNVKKALQYSHRAYIFSLGEIKLEDTGENLLKDEKVKGLFLGK